MFFFLLQIQTSPSIATNPSHLPLAAGAIMAMAGKATAVDVIRGLKRRVDLCRRQYAPWLPSKLDEALGLGVNPTLSLLLDMLLLPLPPPVPDDELGAIKAALYELEDLLDDLDEHAGVRRRPGRPTWKVSLD